MKHQCEYCKKEFSKESTLLVHLCEPKRRFESKNERSVQLGLQAYIKFYEMTQGSAKFKNWDNFVESPYYRAFTKWGKYCIDIRAIKPEQFMIWLIKTNKKLDQWCKDSYYGDYLLEYLKVEPAADAMARAIEQSMDWEEKSNHPAHDYLRYGNANGICYAITTGRISPWVLYGSSSGIEFLENLTAEHQSIIMPYIDPGYWMQKFKDQPGDREWVKEMLTRAGW